VAATGARTRTPVARDGITRRRARGGIGDAVKVMATTSRQQQSIRGIRALDETDFHETRDTGFLLARLDENIARPAAVPG
jgi:hypothetical protein